MDDDQDVQTAESPDTEESTSSDSGGGNLASLAEPSPAPSSNLAQALGSDTGTGQTSAPAQSPQPAQQSQPAQAPLQGLGGRLRGVLYGLATGGLRSAITGAVDPNMERQRYQDQNSIRHSQAQVAQSQAQAAQQNVQFESVKAADTHIRAMKEAQRIDQMNEQGRIEIQQKNAEYQDYLLNKFGIAPDLNISGVGDDVHSQASGGLNTLAAENNGQIPPVHAIVQPHTPDDKNFKIGVYSPNQQDIQKNQAGFRQLVDTERAVKGLGPIDDFTWNSGAGKGYQGQREMALEAQQFLSPVQPFSKDNLPAVLAQRQQQLEAYKSHTDINGKSDADPATVAALSKSVDFLQKAKDDLNKENIQTEVEKQNALANTPQGRLNTAEKEASLEEKQLNATKAMEEPVVGFNKDTGEREITSRANAGNLSQVAPVKEGDIEKWRESTVQFNDVQINVSRYRDAVANFAQHGEPSDLPKINAVINESNLGGKVEFMGGKIEIPGLSSLGEAADRVARSASYKALSPAGKAVVDGYIRTMGAVPAYQKALTNVGRSNEETLRLELRNIPDPTMAPADQERKLQAFQENIDQGSAGIPRIAGVPNPRDVRQHFERSQQGITIPGVGRLTEK